MHNFLQRTNALGTYAATVLAIMCIAVTFTGTFPILASSLLSESNNIDQLAVTFTVPFFSTDHFHVSDPKVSLEFLGAEGLKKQKVGDRVRTFLNHTVF